MSIRHFSDVTDNSKKGWQPLLISVVKRAVHSFKPQKASPLELSGIRTYPSNPTLVEFPRPRTGSAARTNDLGVSSSTLVASLDHELQGFEILSLEVDPDYLQ